MRTSVDLVSVLDDGDGCISCFLATPGGEMRYYKDVRRPEEFVEIAMIIPNTVFVYVTGFEVAKFSRFLVKCQQSLYFKFIRTVSMLLLHKMECFINCKQMREK